MKLSVPNSVTSDTMVHGSPWDGCKCRLFRSMMYCSIFADVVSPSQYSGEFFVGISFQSME